MKIIKWFTNKLINTSPPEISFVEKTIEEVEAEKRWINTLYNLHIENRKRTISLPFIKQKSDR